MPSASDPVSTPSEATRGQQLASLLVRLDVHRRLAEHHAPLRPAEGRLLWLLSDRGPCTLREIGEHLRLEQSTVNRQVNGALSAGLVRRTAQEGRPAKLFEPTDAGMAAYGVVISMVFGACEAALARLEDVDTAEFLSVFERLVDAYGEAVSGLEQGPDQAQ